MTVMPPDANHSELGLVTARRMVRAPCEAQQKMLAPTICTMRNKPGSQGQPGAGVGRQRQLGAARSRREQPGASGIQQRPEAAALAPDTPTRSARAVR